MAELKIPIIYSRIISSVAGRTPTALREVLHGTELGESQGKASAGYMNSIQYAQLLRNAHKVSDDPLIALKAGAQTPLSVHGPLAVAATTSKTLRSSVETMAHYTKIRSPFCDISLHREGSKQLMLFNMQPVLGEQSEAALDFILATIGHNIPHIGCRLPVTFSLKLSRPEPSYAEQYKIIMGCDVVFNQGYDALVFNESDMEIELLGADKGTFDASIGQLRQVLSAFNSFDTTGDAVVNIFIKNTGHLCTLEDVAQDMLVTPRTLQRRLRSEGLSFQSLRDHWLGQQASAYLKQDKLSVEVTATLLGYSDTANFRRSFKRWFKIAPGIYSKM